MVGTLVKAGLSGQAGVRSIDAKTWLADVGKEDARQLLDTVAVKLRDKHGTLALHTAGSASRSLSLVRKWGWNVGDSQRRQTADVVRQLIERAAKDLPPRRQAVVLKAFENYLRETDNKVGRRLIDVVKLLDVAAAPEPSSVAAAPAAILAGSLAGAQASPAQDMAAKVFIDLGLANPQAFADAHLADVQALWSADRSSKGQPPSGRQAQDLQALLKQALGAKQPKVSRELMAAALAWVDHMERAPAPHPDAQDRLDLVKTLKNVAHRRAEFAARAASAVRSLDRLTDLPKSQIQNLQVRLMGQVMAEGLDRPMLARMLNVLRLARPPSLTFARAAASIDLHSQALADARTPEDKHAARGRLLQGLRDAVRSKLPPDQLGSLVHRYGHRLDPQDARLARMAIDMQVCDGLAAQIGKSPVPHASSIRANFLTRDLARELLRSDGRLDAQALAAMPGHLDALGVKGHFLRRHIDAMLGHLRTNAPLRELIDSTPVPASPHGPAADMIRATLGLAPQEPLTALHVRQAMLSALLTPLRQGRVGSCFATSVAIRMQQGQPLEMARDLRQLIEHEQLRLAQKNGDLSTVSLSTLAGTEVLRETLALSVEAGRHHALADDPALHASLSAAGLPPKEIAEAIDAALQAMAARQAAPAGSEGSDAAPLAPVAAQAAAPAKLSVTVQQVIEEVLLAQGQLGRADLADRQSLEQLASEIYVQSAALVEQERRASTDDARARLAESVEQQQQKIEAYQALSERVNDKFQAIEQYDKALALAVSGFQGSTENRLLRAWEYTLSGAAEQSVGRSRQQYLSKTLSRVIGLEPTLATGAAPSPLLEPRTPQHALAQEFLRQVKAHLSFEYDASIVRGLAQDGSSTQGGFSLRYRPPGQAELSMVIDSPVRLQAALEGLYLAAGQQLVDAAPDAAQAEAFRQASISQANAVWSEDFSARVTAQHTAGKALGQPWAVPAGHDPGAAYAARFGLSTADIATATVTMRQPMETVKPAPYVPDFLGLGEVRGAMPAPKERLARPDEAACFLIDTLRKAAARPGSTLAASADVDPDHFSLPVSVQTHAFLLKPGLPAAAGSQDVSLRQAWQDQARAQSSAQWLQSSLAEPSRAHGERALTREQATDILRTTAAGLRAKDPALATLMGIDEQDKPRYAQWSAQVLSGVGDKPPSIIELRKALQQGLRSRVEQSSLRSEAMQFLSASAQEALRRDLRVEEDKDEGLALRVFDDAAIVQQPPPKLVLADTNWGSATAPKHLALLFNPATQESEFWLVDDPAKVQLSRRIDRDTFLKGWSVTVDPDLASQAPQAAA